MRAAQSGARGTEESDSALVTRAQGGDGDAYAALMLRHQEAAFRAAFFLLGETAEAEDAVQDAFVRAHWALGRFRLDAPFRPWLLEIVANTARNRRRSAARRSNLVLKLASSDPSPDGGPSPEAVALANERREALLREVSGLRDEDREAIAYRYFLDLSEAEMASLLGVPRGTVKSRLSRALGRLRERLVSREVAVGILVVMLSLAALLALRPEVRTAIADRLGLRGVTIEQRSMPDLPGGGARPFAAEPDLGELVTLDEARARASFPVLVPDSSELGPPDAVYVLAGISGGQVALVYGDSPGITKADAAGPRLLLVEFRTPPGAANPAAVGKLLPSDTRIEVVQVDGGRALWIEGAPHVLYLPDARGEIRAETVRLAGNVLLWERGDVTLRLEGAVSREVALRIASSAR